MKNIEISSETSRGAPAPSSPPFPWPTISGSDFLLAAWAWPEGANPWFLLDDHGKLERVSSRDLGPLPFLAKGSSPVAFEVADSPFTYSQHLFYLGQDGRVCDIYRGWANGAPTSTWAVGGTWTCPGAPLADTGSPLAGLALRGSLEQRVYYVSADHTLQELLWNGSAWAVKAISAPGSVAVGSGLTALKHGDSPLPSSSSPNLHVYWLGVVDSKPHLFESYVVLTPHSGVFIEGSWIQNDLTAQAGAPCPAAETALSSVALPGVNLVFYVAEDEAIHLIEWQDNQWTDTALPSVPLDPATDLLALHLTVGVALYHVGADQHVHELWRTSGGAWVESDITARAGGPNVLPGTSLRGRSGVATGVNCQTVYYTGADGQVHGLHWSWTAEGGGAWTDTQETSPVNVTLTPKLMKSYRVASPVGSPKDLLTVVNANGHVELMTLRADGTIVNFYPDPTSDTGYRLVDTGLSGSVMAAGVSATGDLVLLAGDGGSLQWVSKPAASTAWSAPQTLSYKAVGSSTMVIEALFAPGNVAPPGGPWPPLSLGAWMHEQDSNDNTGHLYLWEWGSTPSPTLRLDPGSAAWDFEWDWATSATGALMAVGAASASSSIWVISQGVARTLHVSDLCVQSLATKAGSAKIYAVLSDGTVNGLDLDSDNPAWECVAGAQAFPSTKASALRATQDPESRSTHLFVCTEDKVLWHVRHPGDAFAEAGDPAPLLPNVGTFAVGTTPDTFMHAFAAPPYAGALMHLTSTDTISTAEGDWQVSPLEVPVPGAVEEYW